MTVTHGLYALVLSAVYFAIALLDRDLAESLTILFVVLVISPAPFSWWHRRGDA